MGAGDAADGRGYLVVGHETALVIGHVVTAPRATRHLNLRLMTDVELLLADAIASVRMGQRVLVYDPPFSVTTCASCEQAYRLAKKTIDDAGGLACWMARFRA